MYQNVKSGRMANQGYRMVSENSGSFSKQGIYKKDTLPKVPKCIPEKLLFTCRY